MTDRIYFAPDALLISKPGVAASPSTPAADRIFDPLNKPYNGMFMRGRILNADMTSVTSTTVSSNDTVTKTATVNFGRTFPAPPQVYYGLYDGSTVYFEHREIRQASTLIGNYCYSWVEIGVSSVTFKIQRILSAAASPFAAGIDMDVVYMVMNR